MRAAVLRQPGAAISVDDVDLAPLEPGMVRVRLAASGLCHSDLSVADGTLPLPLPAVLGHEGAGIVAEVGPDVTGLQPGDRVVLSWAVPCRACRPCLRGRPELCDTGMDHAFTRTHGTLDGADVWAVFGTGTLAEQTVVPAAAAIRIGEEAPLDLAALVGCAVLTGVGAAVNTAGIRPGDTVAVIGCGGVGLATVQGARLAGAATIVAVDRAAGRLPLATANGATHVVDASAADPVEAVRELTGGRGVDHAVEAVGRSATIEAAYAMATRGGTVTVVGAGAADDPVTFGAMGLMADAKVLQGCVYGGADPARDIPWILDLAAQGRLDLEALVTARVGLDRIDDAVAAMRAAEGARTLVTFPTGDRP
jgi:S-(hydroxymethyl)glutathione dehydrogenase / alcohol dehydrogenase